MRLFYLLAIATCLSSCNSSKKSVSTSGWKLVWSDEFNYKGLPDSSKWNYDVGGDGWGNNEKQFYLGKSIENSYVTDGNLHIVALKKIMKNQTILLQN